MRNQFLAGVAFVMALSSHAQDAKKTDSTRVDVLSEVVVSFNKFGDLRKNSSQKIEIINSKTIARYNSQNTGDLLSNTGNVFVQKSQQGGSSPVIRGFEASRVLLVIDGIRMNNAIYRSGHLQNIITVDQNLLDHVEVMYGPSSTLYGSDALGGIIHLRTKLPMLSQNNKTQVLGNSLLRYSSVNQEKTLHADLNLGGNKWAWLQSYSFSDFGDMRMGSHYSNAYPNFGRRSEYITQINGIDSIVKNSNDRVQRFSGYKQWDLLEKILFKPSEKFSHLLNLQYSNTTNVPRYDRLQDIKSGVLRYAEWYYGPQERLMTSYELKASHWAGFDEVVLNLSQQNIRESRQTREYRRYDRFDSRREHLNVSAYSLDFHKKWDQHQITVGTDGQFNALSSVADRTHLLTGVKTKLDTRYPDGQNHMNFIAVYFQHQIKLKKERLILNDGIRYQHTSLRSSLIDNSFFNLPWTEYLQKTKSVTGNLGLVYFPKETSRISANLSSGFRAPNIDDLVKIFESSTAARQVVFPNPNIKPEYTYNIDFSGETQIASKLRIEGTVFYTSFRNALVKAPFQINGQDSILYNGIKSQILANQNKNKAYLYGFSALLNWKFSSNWNLISTLHFTKGFYETDPQKATTIYKKAANGSYILTQDYVKRKPLDHIPPVFGKTALRYETERGLELEAYLIFNSWKKLDQYNPDGEDNGQYATSDGMPSWHTLNFKANWKASDKWILQTGIENVFDRNYRQFASGFSAPGRNWIIAVRRSW